MTSTGRPSDEDASEEYCPAVAGPAGAMTTVSAKATAAATRPARRLCARRGREVSVMSEGFQFTGAPDQSRKTPYLPGSFGLVRNGTFVLWCHLNGSDTRLLRHARPEGDTPTATR